MTIMFELLLAYIIFFFGYFNFWRDLSFTLVSFIPMFMNRYYYHGDEANFVIFYVILVLPYSILNLFMIYICITKAGFLFIESEIMRGGNEQVLDGLKEGVVIFSEAEKNILYYNSAAMRSSSKFTERILIAN